MKKLKTRFFELEYEDGTVRRIKNNGIEIVRMIYSALRDQNWGTVEPKVIEEEFHESDSDFHVETKVKYQKAEIQFDAVYTISATENRLEFSMKGEAKSTFMTNRTGFCVLHPINECAGKSCTVFHPDGSSEVVLFPIQIAPYQPMKNISGLSWNPSDNISAILWFTGDIFEMEDQRNWTDASYKTYCRPLDLPFPFQINKGDKIHQHILLELECEPQTENENDIITFEIDKSQEFKVPAIGLEKTSRPEILTKNEAEILKQFSFSHLRAEIHLFNQDWETELKKSAAESDILNVPLFLVIYFSKDVQTEIKKLANAIRELSVKVNYILPVGKNHLPDNLIFDSVFNELKSIFPKAQIGAGVNAYYAELNRNRDISEQADFISFTICPQVHAFDNNTLVENLEAQKYVVESAKKLFPGKSIFVSPVTLKQRFNVVATTPEPPLKSGELTSQVDVRQNSVFAAQWLLGSLRFLAQSEADLVTYFETVGWRGIIQGDFDPPFPEKFTAKKGDVFPVFQLLCEFSGFEKAVFSESFSPLEVDGIALKKTDKSGKALNKILLANFSSQPKKVKISGIDDFQNGKTLFSGILLKQKKGVLEIPPDEVAVISGLNTVK